MPHARRTLTETAAEDLCALMFAPSEQRIGLELEWPVHRDGDTGSRPGPDAMARAARCRLPRGSRVTFEPGGQVELSSAPRPSVVGALEAARADEQALRSELAALGLAARTIAVDDRRPPARVLDQGRYAAMEAFFDAQGRAGRWMMCNTAAIQVNISHDAGDPAERWRIMHLIAPVLIASFANSPGTALDGTPWASVRQAIWQSIDPARTRPVRTDLPPGRAWLDYALAADVMFICGKDPRGRGGIAVPPGLPFGAWMADGHDAGWPTADDLRYHLSTLFPPVRPRGWLELRALDALPGRLRDIATLTVATACTRPAARELSARLPPLPPQPWLAAARHGLRHPALRTAARRLFAVVHENLGGVTSRGEHADLITAYRSEYVNADRTPGDDLPRTVNLLSPACAPALARS